MALEQAIKDALKKAKDNPEDLKELFETIGINITFPAPPADKNDKEDMKKWFDDLKAVITKNKEDVKTNPDSDKTGALAEKLTLLETSLGKLAERLEKADKQIENERKTQLSKSVTDYIADMEKDGRLAPKDEEKKKLYSELLEKDFEVQKKVFDGLPKNPALANPTVAPAAPTADVAGDKRSEHEKMAIKARDQIKQAISVN